MRVGSTVLLREQYCVQSYGWSLLRPLGVLQGVLDSLEEYQCDEVTIIRPVKENDTLEQYSKDIAIIRNLKTMTPISFGGGIRTKQHLELLVDLPIERLVFSSAFLENNEELIVEAKNIFGHQAIQCILPVKMVDNNVWVYSSSKNSYAPLSNYDLEFIDDLSNEIILYDTVSEGSKSGFNFDLVDNVPFLANKLIISGGVVPKSICKGIDAGIASVLIENKVLHQEYSITGYKHAKKMS